LLRAEPGKRQFCVAELGSGRKEKMRGEKRRSVALAFLPSVRTKNSRDSFALDHRQTIALCCRDDCASADLDLQSRIAVSVKNGAIFFDEEMEFVCVFVCTRAKYKPPLPPFSPSG
jgi:hypothetical protein